METIAPPTIDIHEDPQALCEYVTYLQADEAEIAQRALTIQAQRVHENAMNRSIQLEQVLGRRISLITIEVPSAIVMPELVFSEDLAAMRTYRTANRRILRQYTDTTHILKVAF